MTSIEHPLPVNADTLFQIGSITKTFTGTAVMRLVEMGQLDLDTQVRAYLPDLRLASQETASRVTLRHLLTHTGGWVGDYFDDLGPGDDALAQMVAKVADLPQLTPLGEIWSYNNSGFYLAGRVIEAVTGKAFEVAVKELVLDPLGLAMSFFFATDVITHRFAVGHHVVEKEPKVARPWAVGRAAHPAGGIISSVKDLLRYARFHMGDGTAPDRTRLLTPESLALMQTPMFPATGISLVGLTWFMARADETWIIGHGGGTNGQITEFRLVPARGFAISTLTNSDEGGELCYEITKWALKHYLGVALPEAVPRALPEERLAPYVGRYVSAMAIDDVSLSDGGLVLQVTYKGGFPTKESPPLPSPAPVRLAVYDEDRVFVLDPPMKDARGEFLRNPDGSIAWFRFGGRVHAREG